MLQVVQPGVRVMAPRRGFADTVVYDAPAVREKYGLDPAQLISYKALVGDTSDNIPGVKGIGEKTAVKLLQQFNDLDGIYSHLDEVEPERIRALLRESHETAMQNSKLAAIVTDVPMPFDLAACAVSSYDRNKVVDIFRELGFSAMLSRLPDEIGSAPAAAPRQEPSQGSYTIVDSLQKLDELALRLSYAGTFAISVVPGGDNPMLAGLVGIAISPARGESYYIPVGHTTLDRIEQPGLDKGIQVARYIYNSGALRQNRLRRQIRHHTDVPQRAEDERGQFRRADSGLPAGRKVAQAQVAGIQPAGNRGA